jgi:hypothetical protein
MAAQNNQGLSAQRGKPLTRVILLIKNVANPKKPCITKPANIHLISEIPEPAAYFASDRTKWAATKENMACVRAVVRCAQQGKRCKRTHRKYYIDKPPRDTNGTPGMPGFAPVRVLAVYFPAAELLVEPPPVVAIPHLDV